MFTLFKKIEKNRHLNRNGCGLGLTISKNLAQSLGGDILVESVVGVGSTFTIILHEGFEIAPNEISVQEIEDPVMI